MTHTNQNAVSTVPATLMSRRIRRESCLTAKPTIHMRRMVAQPGVSGRVKTLEGLSVEVA